MNFLPLKWKRRLNKVLRALGLKAPVQKRLPKSQSV